MGTVESSKWWGEGGTLNSTCANVYDYWKKKL